MLPGEGHDELARNLFVAALRQHTMEALYPEIRTRYESHLIPAYVTQHGHRPTRSDHARELLESSAFFQGYSLLVRGTQELLWDSAGEVIERQLGELMGRAKALCAEGDRPTLDPELPVPDYTAAVDIHVMPGGYHTELCPDDVFAGALYDRGVYLFAFGGLGVLNEELGLATANAVRQQFPDWAPAAILDLGCGVGHSTLPLRDAFPSAEVTGLDLGAPMVRYAAARAAALGRPARFVQGDATRTRFPDESFDLIASSLLLHELPRAAIVAVLQECHRLLRPGGVMVHHDLLRWPDDPFDAAMMGWTTRHNNEPYERASGTLDFPGVCASVGFRPEDVFVVAQPGVYLEEVYQVSGIRGARKRA
jgi:SAM-dependent methyltransferase